MKLIFFLLLITVATSYDWEVYVEDGNSCNKINTCTKCGAYWYGKDCGNNAPIDGYSDCYSIKYGDSHCTIELSRDKVKATYYQDSLCSYMEHEGDRNFLATAYGYDYISSTTVNYTLTIIILLFLITCVICCCCWYVILVKCKERAVLYV